MRIKIKKLIIAIIIIVICLGLFLLINKLVKEKQVKQNTANKVIYLTNDKAIDLVKEVVKSSDSNYNTYTYNIIEEQENYLIVEVSSKYGSMDKYMLTYTEDQNESKVLDCINKMARDTTAKTITLTGEWIGK